MTEIVTVDDLAAWDDDLRTLTEGLGWLFHRPEPKVTFGLMVLSANETRRLMNLLASAATEQAKTFGLAWSNWRRRHQAIARWHHWRARLRAPS